MLLVNDFCKVRIVSHLHNPAEYRLRHRLLLQPICHRLNPLHLLLYYQAVNHHTHRLHILQATQLHLLAAGHPIYPLANQVSAQVASRAASLQTSLVENRLLLPHHIRRFCSRWHFSRRVVVITPHLYCGRWIAWVMLAMTPLCF